MSNFSNANPYCETIFVTMLWQFKDESHNFNVKSEHLTATLAMLANRKLIAFYNSRPALDELRHQAFEQNISLVALPIASKELPGAAYVDEFIKRAKSYGLSQGEGGTHINPLDKSFHLYWFGYRKYGEKVFREALRLKLSRVGLTGEHAPQNSPFLSRNFCWINADASQYDYDGALKRSLTINFVDDVLYTMPSDFEYLGERLPISSLLMGSTRQNWARLIPLYEGQISRLGDFPYCYDDEVILSLVRAQHPELFRDFSAKDNRLLEAKSA